MYYNNNWRNPYAQVSNQTPVPKEKTIREELEEQFRLEEERQRQQSLIAKPDYSHLSLREELEARFRDMENEEKNQNITPVPPAKPVSPIAPTDQMSPLPQGFNQYTPIPSTPITPWNPGYQNYESNPFPQPMDDASLIDNIFPDLTEHERAKNFMYLDTKGNKTIGIGKNIDNWDDFNQINWTIDGRPATLLEKLQAFKKFEELKQNNKYGQKFGADLFKKHSNLRISDQEIKDLATNHLQQNIKYLHNKFPDFDRFPLGLKRVLLDIAYNTGNVDKEKWPNLHKAIKAKNLADIKANVHRKDIHKDRNEWAEEQIDSIKSWY